MALSPTTRTHWVKITYHIKFTTDSYYLIPIVPPVFRAVIDGRNLKMDSNAAFAVNVLTDDLNVYQVEKMNDRSTYTWMDWERREAGKAEKKRLRQRELGIQMMILKAVLEGRVVVKSVRSRTGGYERKAMVVRGDDEEVDMYITSLPPETESTYSSSTIPLLKVLMPRHSRPWTPIDYDAGYGGYDDYDGYDGYDGYEGGDEDDKRIANQRPMAKFPELSASSLRSEWKVSVGSGKGSPTDSDKTLIDILKGYDGDEEEEERLEEEGAGTYTPVVDFGTADTRYSRRCSVRERDPQLTGTQHEVEDSVPSVANGQLEELQPEPRSQSQGLTPINGDHQTARSGGQQSMAISPPLRSQTPQPQITNHSQPSITISPMSPPPTPLLQTVDNPHQQLELIDKWETALHHLEQLSQTSSNARHSSHAALLARLGRTLDVTSSVPAQFRKWTYRLDQLRGLQQEAQQADHRKVAGWLLDYVEKLEVQLDRVQADVIRSEDEHEDVASAMSGLQSLLGLNDDTSRDSDQYEPKAAVRVSGPRQSPDTALSKNSSYVKADTFSDVVEPSSDDFTPLSEYPRQTSSLPHHRANSPSTVRDEDYHSSLHLNLYDLIHKPLPPLPLSPIKPAIPLRNPKRKTLNLKRDTWPLSTSSAPMEPLFQIPAADSTPAPSISEAAVERWLTPADAPPMRQVSLATPPTQHSATLPVYSSPDTVSIAPVSLASSPSPQRHSLQVSSRPASTASPKTAILSFLSTHTPPVRPILRSLSAHTRPRESLPPSTVLMRPLRSALRSPTLESSLPRQIRKKVDFEKYDEIMRDKGYPSAKRKPADLYHTMIQQERKKRTKFEENMNRAEGEALQRAISVAKQDSDQERDEIERILQAEELQHEVPYWEAGMDEWEHQRNQQRERQMQPNERPMLQNFDRPLGEQQLRRLWEVKEAQREARQRGLELEREQQKERQKQERKMRNRRWLTANKKASVFGVE